LPILPQFIDGQLVKKAINQYVTSYPVARIYMVLGETEEAFRWLEAAYSEHSAMMVFLKTDPRFAELHPEPRFQELLRRMSFPN